MNILIYVMTMLMLLALMTYARIEGFRDLSVLQSLFETYMQTLERKSFNDREIEWYNDKHHKKEETNSTEEKQVRIVAPGSRKLSLYPILIAKQKDSLSNDQNSGKYLQTVNVFKKLLFQLYGQQSFYNEMEQIHPGLIDDFVNALIIAARSPAPSKDNELPSKNPTVADLNKLQLNDFYLNKFLYTILQKDSLTTSKVSSNDDDEHQSNDDNNKFTNLEVPIQAAKLPNVGYKSLQDMVTLINKPSIRIALAPRELLLVLFSDPNLVDNIMATRQDLYNLVSRGGNPEEASREFSTLYKDKRDPNLEESFLDFTISKTNPQKNE
jgi:hypothetical protein